MPPISIVAPELRVPLLEAPRLGHGDVSSGPGAVAAGLDELAKAQRAAALNDTQIDLATRFRALADDLRATPVERQRELFEQHAARIGKDVLGIADKQLRALIELDFRRSHAALGARVDQESWTGLAFKGLSDADAEAERLIGDIAAARNSDERDHAVDQLGSLYGNLAAANVIDDATRRSRISTALNKAAVLATRTAIDDPTRDPTETARDLRNRSRHFHLTPADIENLTKLAEYEAVRRRGAATVEAAVADAVRRQAAPGIVRDNVISLFRSGRAHDDDGLAALDHLPPDQQASARAQLAAAARIFSATGDIGIKSASEINRALEELKTEGESVHAQARAYADSIIADRARDPAVAVMSVPSVAASWAAFDANPSTGNLQAALRVSQAAQTALGIPQDARRLLPIDRAEAEARAVLDKPPRQQWQAYKDFQSRYGDFAPAVARQIDHFFAPELTEAAAQSSPLTGELMWRRAVAVSGAGGPRSELLRRVSDPPEDSPPGWSPSFDPSAIQQERPSGDLLQSVVRATTKVDRRGRVFTFRGREFHLPFDSVTRRDDPIIVKGAEFLASVGLDPTRSAMPWIRGRREYEALRDDPAGRGLLLLDSLGRPEMRDGRPRVVTWDELHALGKMAELAQKDSWLYRAWDEGAIQVGAGALEAARNTLAVVEDLYRDWSGLSAVEAGAHWTDTLFPDLPPADTEAGKIVRDLSRFFTGFIPIMRATKSVALAGEGAGKALKFGQWVWSAVAADAATGFLTSDPQGPRLLNRMWRYFRLPENILTNFLDGKADDTAIEGRLKNAVDTGVMSLAMATAIKGVAIFARAGATLKAEWDSIEAGVRNATDIPADAAKQFPRPKITTVTDAAPPAAATPVLPTEAPLTSEAIRAARSAAVSSDDELSRAFAQAASAVPGTALARAAAKDLQAQLRTRPPPKNGGPFSILRPGKDDRHHLVTRLAGPFWERYGPTVTMPRIGHKSTGSWGRARSAQKFREKQIELIRAGKIKEAVMMGVDDLRGNFPGQFDEAIDETRTYFPRDWFE